MELWESGLINHSSGKEYKLVVVFLLMLERIWCGGVRVRRLGEVRGGGG